MPKKSSGTKSLGFKRIKTGTSSGKYKSPSGRVFDLKQIRLAYWTKNFTDKTKLAQVRKSRRKK